MFKIIKKIQPQERVFQHDTRICIVPVLIIGALLVSVQFITSRPPTRFTHAYTLL